MRFSLPSMKRSVGPSSLRPMKSTVSLSELYTDDLITARSAVVGSCEKPPNIWLMVAKNAFVGWALNKVRMLLKGAVIGFWNIQLLASEWSWQTIFMIKVWASSLDIEHLSEVTVYQCLQGNHNVCWFFNKNRTFREETTSVLAGGREKLEKDPGSKVQTNNKLKPHRAPCKNRTQGTLVESKRSHHPCSPKGKKCAWSSIRSLVSGSQTRNQISRYSDKGIQASQLISLCLFVCLLLGVFTCVQLVGVFVWWTLSALGNSLPNTQSP